jgi:hypothetical protein
MTYRVIDERTVEETRWLRQPLIWVLVDDPTCTFSGAKLFRKWVNQHGTSVYAQALGNHLTLLVERWKHLQAVTP